MGAIIVQKEIDREIEERDNEEVKLEAVQSLEDVALIEAMTRAGVAFGHKKSKGHPKMAPYIYTVRSEIQIIDAGKTLTELRKAITFLSSILANGGKILFVGTHASGKEIIVETAKELHMPYVSDRWLGGTLTNFHTMKKRITYFLDLEKKKLTGELEKYTKKERLLFDRELKKLENNLGGIKHMEKLPEAMFVVDVKTHDTAVREARKMGIPVVAMCDTDSNPTPIQYIIPSNDNSSHSIKCIVGMIKEELLKVKAPGAEIKK